MYSFLFKGARQFSSSVYSLKPVANFVKQPARIVLNHSTHCDHLLVNLREISLIDSISTIIPGRLKATKACESQFKLKITSETPTGFRLIARKGSVAQEVFIVLNSGKKISAEELQELINAKILER